MSQEPNPPRLARHARRRRPWMAALVALPALAGAAPHADVVIWGGLVYTGGKEPAFATDVVITGDTIRYVGPSAAKMYSASMVIDARGKIVAPGFIDAHTHPDTYVRSPDARERLNAPWLYQGVTTLLVGVDGAGTPDVALERAAFERAKIGTNLVPYVGFAAVRERVLGEADRAPTDAELRQMKALVAKGMCEGAIGLSTGLFYPPQSFAKTDEVIALAREAAKRGGIYDTHQRDESSYSIGLLNSVREVLDIGREAGLPVHIAHIKALGVDVHGEAPRVIRMIDTARANGEDVTADEYPWTASGSSLEAALLPRAAFDGGRPALLKRLADPEQRAAIRVAMLENLRRRGGAESLLLTAAGSPWVGKTLAKLAAEWQVEPVDAALKVIAETEGQDAVASFNMIEDDVKAFMKQDWVVTSSDGSDGHPRQFATFPEKYVKYVKGAGVIGVDEFIRGSTGRTADMFRLPRRGYLKAGYYADLVIIDPEHYAPKADYVHPRELSTGVVDVWVNGQQVIELGRLTGRAPGRVLLHTPRPGSCAAPARRAS